MLECLRHRIIAANPITSLRRPDNEVSNVGDERTDRASPGLIDVGAAHLVAEHPRWMIRGDVLLAPLAQTVDRRPQCDTDVGEDVLDAAPLRASLNHPGTDQGVQPFGQDCAGDIEVGQQVTEVTHTVEAVAQDQQGPPFADNLESARQETGLAVISGA